ncbi:hypothetical protein [Streptomyces sp. NPDC058861]|uniref:hypothetical protein n=1 Tax=Streptomyces sp. NPDC058861 TaxID=3346653 RepID=UPI003687910C
MSMSDIDWGDAPTWVAAVFAGGAAWFAGMTLRSQRRQIGEQQEFIREQSRNLQLERAELLTVAEERRTAQAKRVAMAMRTAGGRENDYGGFDGYDHWRVTVTNGSDEPLKDVTVRFGNAYTAASANDEGSRHLPDDGRRPVPVPLIAPRGVVQFASPTWEEATVDNHRPIVLFTDANGARWQLDEHGALTPRPPESTS